MHAWEGTCIRVRMCACVHAYMCVSMHVILCMRAYMMWLLHSLIHTLPHPSITRTKKNDNLWHTCNDLGINWDDHPWETLVCLECPYELLGWLSRALGLWFGWISLFMPCPTHYGDRMPAQQFLYCQYSASCIAGNCIHVITASGDGWRPPCVQVECVC